MHDRMPGMIAHADPSCNLITGSATTNAKLGFGVHHTDFDTRCFDIGNVLNVHTTI